MSKPVLLAIPACSINSGMDIRYAVQVGDKEIISHGEVVNVRRVGKHKVEITLLHAKTSALFVNVLDAKSRAFLFVGFAQPEYIEMIKAGLPLSMHASAETWLHSLVADLEKKLHDTALAFYDAPIAR